MSSVPIRYPKVAAIAILSRFFLVIWKAPNSVYTDAGVRISIDMGDAENVALISCHSVTWDFGCQYNNVNMPDVFLLSPYRTKPLSMAAWGMAY